MPRYSLIRALLFPCFAIVALLYLALSLNAQALLNVPDRMEVSLFAGEELMANPVAIHAAADGAVYVAEAHRKNTGVWGVTFSRWWAIEDYGNRTLADRMAMYNRWQHQVSLQTLSRESDLIRLVRDNDGDGVADDSTVFADGLDEAWSGNAAGVLAVDDTVFIASVPDLIALHDEDDDGRADMRSLLHRGFGVRVGVHGHDFHGLTLGPDGRIYFSVGDRGYDVTSREDVRFHAPTRGAVFRCEPDGSGLELFHDGLRNPQELAFNDRGDLFTVDNNMSGGDECRVLHLLEGADSGWDATYQLTRNFRAETGREDHIEPPWFTEELWQTASAERPAWVNPAIAHLTRGPSGLASYPGVGLDESWADWFFVADFVGSSANSGIVAFQLKPNGAGYELTESRQFIWNVLATDLDFAPDGSILIADWISGWNGTGGGRIWRTTSPHAWSPADRDALATLSKRSFKSMRSDELGELLSHPDRRIRLRSQLALAERPREWRNTFQQVLASNTITLPARLHAIWGLEIIARRHPSHRDEIAPELITQLGAKDHEVRAQAAAALVSTESEDAFAPLLTMLEDSSTRARYHAAMALGKIGNPAATRPLLALIRKSDDRSLLHAATWALARVAPTHELTSALVEENPSVRLGAVLALRKGSSPAIEAALQSEDPRVLSEAIRAIHDLPVEEAWSAMAGLLEGPDAESILSGVPTPIAWRLLNANFRLGDRVHASRVAAIAGSSSIDPKTRDEAMSCLAHWSDPSPFDRATWHHRPLPERNAPWMRELVRPIALDWIRSLESPSAEVSERFQNAILRLITETGCLKDSEVLPLLSGATIPVPIKRTLLNTMTPTDRASETAVSNLLHSPDAEMRADAAAALARADLAQGWTALEATLERGDISAQQRVIEHISLSESPRARTILLELIDRYEADELPDALSLDLIERGRRSKHVAVTTRLQMILEHLTKTEPLGANVLALRGGNQKEGRRVFEQHATQCIRCHRVNEFGGHAGPDLTHIGSQISDREILEAMLDPQARIAPGFGMTQITLTDGELIAGYMLDDAPNEIQLRLADNSEVRIDREKIATFAPAISGMPPMGELLTPLELRDLTAYLSSLK